MNHIDIAIQTAITETRLMSHKPTSPTATPVQNWVHEVVWTWLGASYIGDLYTCVYKIYNNGYIYIYMSVCKNMYIFKRSAEVYEYKTILYIYTYLVYKSH